MRSAPRWTERTEREMSVTSRAASLALFLVVLVGTAACDATPDYLKEQARRKRLSEVGVEQFDSAGAFALAGMSTHREIQIEALDPLTLGADTLASGYHTLHMRCGSCHEVPDPATKPAYLWDGVISRMKKNAADAGLVPMSGEDEREVLKFLRNHAEDRRR